MEKIALTIDIIGKIMVAYTALTVHTRVRKEQKIDNVVLKAMKLEGAIGVTGILLMIAGYLIHLFV